MHAFVSGVLAAVLMVAGAGQLAQARETSRKLAGDDMDVVLILTDDQPEGTLAAMPRLQRLLAGRGTTYTNAMVPTSLCCPSRVSLLTGKLATSSGVYSNDSETGVGGYPALKASGLEQDTIATALDSAGYRTGYFGKYLNEYGPLYDGIAPPGWDTWRAFTTNRSGKYRNYAVADAVPFGRSAKRARQEFVRKYSTTYFGNLAAEHIRSAPSKDSLFTVFAPYAPHAPFTAVKKYRGTSRLPGDYRNPSVLEKDVSDKPAYVRGIPLTNTVAGAAPGAHLRQQMDALRSVDDQVRNLYRAVRDSGRLERTVFIYVSDNGYMHGEHRLEGKGYPYRKSTLVPMVVRYGRGAPAAIDDRLRIANVDLTATILEAAGLPNTSQGRPVRGPGHVDGAALVGVEATSRVVRPPFCGWRTEDELFVRYGTGEEEYYDYRSDPYELVNRVAAPGAADRVAALRQRARTACSTPPPDYGPEFDLPRWKPVRGGGSDVPPIEFDSEDRVSTA